VIQVEFEAPEQVKPASTVHVLEHPSPLIVLQLSHVSAPKIIQSPQIPEHTLGPVALPQQHYQLAFIPKQFAAHAAFENALSQTSFPTTKPSPQLGVHCIGIGIGHVQPASLTHVEEHPSPEAVFPSSQFSGALIARSPQIALHTVGFVPTQV
jgi:hypothetical protein